MRARGEVEAAPERSPYPQTGGPSSLGLPDCYLYAEAPVPGPMIPLEEAACGARGALVFHSASMSVELAEQARDFGVTALLEKPVSPDRIVEVVRAATAPGSRRPHPATEP